RVQDQWRRHPSRTYSQVLSHEQWYLDSDIQERRRRALLRFHAYADNGASERLALALLRDFGDFNAH
ncbi:hypothetical protein ACFL33_03160, partial [Pseudomonadota bacterium]